MKKLFIIMVGLIVVIVVGGCLDLGGIFPFLNQAPVITSKPIITATADQLYLYQVEASDPDGDTLTYSFTAKPEGMGIDSESGLITWIPTNAQIGINWIEVEISDGKHITTQGFDIEVVNVNNPPQIFSYFPANLNFAINEGSTVKFEVQTSDVDVELNTVLSYQWLLNGKKVLSFTISEDGLKSSWTYSAGYGDYSQKTVKVLVSDGELQNYVQWNITINDITPPAKPTLGAVTSPTNISPQILSGTKETNSSIWLNGAEVVSLDSSTNWSYSYNLSEGTNNISITSRDAAGNKSSPVTTTIEYDPNIYVDADNTTGIEDGTPTHPFDTIAEGIEAVAPGKSVVVSKGIYNEQLIISKEGIILQGASRNSTFITGSDLIGNLITVTADYVTISGFKIDGKLATSMGIYSDSSSSIEISGNIIQGHRNSGILYHRTSSDYPSGIYVYDNEICHNSLNGVKVTGAGSGIIESNIIRNNDCGIFAYNDASLEVKKNNIYNNYDSGIFCRDNSSLLIWENEIRTNSYGINIGASTSDTADPDIGGGVRGGVGKNNIAGNTSNGVRNMTKRSIFAKYNWWGDSTGPKYPGNTLSSGDWAYWSETGGNINFTPCLTESQTF